ncbi:MAG: acylphosphatase [Chloroflexi bacterium]|nr:acylphosphatase [Chloroflexota bacterium]
MTEPKPGDPVRIHIWVTGHVQGVGFRSFVQQSGVLSGLTGWVRNVGYDTLETVAEGPRDKAFPKINLNLSLRAIVPSEARIVWETARGEFQNFGIKYGV